QRLQIVEAVRAIAAEPAVPDDLAGVVDLDQPAVLAGAALRHDAAGQHIAGRAGGDGVDRLGPAGFDQLVPQLVAGAVEASDATGGCGRAACAVGGGSGDQEAAVGQRQDVRIGVVVEAAPDALPLRLERVVELDDVEAGPAQA